MATQSTARSMYGRKQIFTSEAVIDRSNVIDVLNEALKIHAQNREDEEYLEDYVRGRQPILDRVKAYRDEINNKIVVNIANQIVTFKTAEFAGEPIQYITRGGGEDVPDKVTQLNSMMLSEGKQSKDMELAYNIFTYGVGYRLTVHDPDDAEDEELFDEAPFEMFIPDPKNTFVVRLYDVSKRVVMGVTYVYTDSRENRVRFTVYTPNETFTIEGTASRAEKIVDNVKHNFGLVSLVEYPCNPLYMGAFEVVLPLLDAINTTQSNRLDGIEQFIQAIMVFEGVDIMPSQGDGSTSDSSNNGAVIMRNGWWNAEARSLETEGMWKASETEFLKIVLKICRDTNELGDLMVSNVEPKFGRRSYEDLLVKTQSFSTLRSAGCPSIQAFKFSKLSKDPESDAKQFDDYQEEQAAKLDALAGVGAGDVGDDGSGGGGGSESLASASSSSTSATVEGTGHPKNSIGICPICHRSFKKTANNQKYDRAECREKAKNANKEAGGNQ